MPVSTGTYCGTGTEIVHCTKFAHAHCTWTLQASMLVKKGKQVVIVTSGAVGVGRQIMRKHALLSTSVRHMVDGYVLVYCCTKNTMC